jgi:hypothetical protein
MQAELHAASLNGLRDEGRVSNGSALSFTSNVIKTKKENFVCCRPVCCMIALHHDIASGYPLL